MHACRLFILKNLLPDCAIVTHVTTCQGRDHIVTEDLKPESPRPRSLTENVFTACLPTTSNDSFTVNLPLHYWSLVTRARVLV